MVKPSHRRCVLLLTSLDAEAVSLLQAGQHIILLSVDPIQALEGRRFGLMLRDTLLVLSAGQTEFAFLFRKEMEGTVAENVLRHGQGGLWIDGCRVKSDEYLGRLNHKTSKFINGANGVRATHNRTIFVNNSTGKGRWPSNLVFVHGPECRERNSIGYGLETVAAWVCQEDCVVKALDQQSGNLPTQKSRSNPDAPTAQGLGLFGQASKQKNGPEYFGDSGGASRFFPQFAHRGELLEWLRRLLGG